MQHDPPAPATVMPSTPAHTSASSAAHGASGLVRSRCLHRRSTVPANAASVPMYRTTTCAQPSPAGCQSALDEAETAALDEAETAALDEAAAGMATRGTSFLQFSFLLFTGSLESSIPLEKQGTQSRHGLRLAELKSDDGPGRAPSVFRGRPPCFTPIWEQSKSLRGVGAYTHI